MPRVIHEGQLRFTFDDSWDVVKLDEHAFFLNRLMPLQLTRSVDILGLHRQSALYFIEIKDYRGSAVELKNHEKMHENDTLLLQVARKAKDSVVCVAGAARMTKDGFWIRCADILREPCSIVKMVFWLEFDLGRRGHGRNPVWIEQEMRIKANSREKDLKSRLNWLTREVLVTNQVTHAGALPGVTVEDIGRAGHRGT